MISCAHREHARACVHKRACAWLEARNVQQCEQETNLFPINKIDRVSHGNRLSRIPHVYSHLQIFKALCGRAPEEKQTTYGYTRERMGGSEAHLVGPNKLDVNDS